MPRKVLKLAGFKQYEPEVMFEDNCRDWSIKDCNRPGSDVEFLKLILDSAGFDYEVLQMDFNSSDLIIDIIANGTADMSVLGLKASPSRLKQVSFSLPINYQQFGYLAKELSVLESDEFLLKTFQLDVYAVLVCMIALVAGFAFLAYRNHKYETWLWFHFASFFNQAGHPRTKQSSFLFLTGFYWFTAFLIICFYQARMKYFLTVPLQRGVDFHTMNELLDQLEFGNWKGYYNELSYNLKMYCRREQCERIKKLEKMNRLVYFPNVTKLVPHTASTYYAVTFDAYNLDLVPNEISLFDRKERLLFIRDTSISIDIVAFAINKNLTVELELINRAIARFQGTYENVRGRYTSPKPRYEVDSVENGAVTLTLYHMNILFFAYIGMMGCALIIFGVEFLHYRYNWRSDGTWRPQGKSYDLNQKVILSTDSTLKDVQFTRKTIKFYIEEKIAELQKAQQQ